MRIKYYSNINLKLLKYYLKNIYLKVRIFNILTEYFVCKQTAHYLAP